MFIAVDNQSATRSRQVWYYTRARALSLTGSVLLTIDLAPALGGLDLSLSLSPSLPLSLWHTCEYRQQSI